MPIFGVNYRLLLDLRDCEAHNFVLEMEALSIAFGGNKDETTCMDGPGGCRGSRGGGALGTSDRQDPRRGGIHFQDKTVAGALARQCADFLTGGKHPGRTTPERKRFPAQQT